VKLGTFMDYRRWKGEKMNVGTGQIKVPVVLLDCAGQEWVAKRVVKEF
jgi:auxin responsive GH3 family protein